MISPAGSPSCTARSTSPSAAATSPTPPGSTATSGGSLVAEGRGAEFVDTTTADAATARATAMPVLAGVLDAIAAGYCHQLGRWAEADELLGDLDPQRLDGIVQLVVAALLDIDRGDARPRR